jgi:hypothetical protein
LYWAVLEACDMDIIYVHVIKRDPRNLLCEPGSFIDNFPLPIIKKRSVVGASISMKKVLLRVAICEHL